MRRQELDFWVCAGRILDRMRTDGVLCTVVIFPRSLVASKAEWYHAGW